MYTGILDAVCEPPSMRRIVLAGLAVGLVLFSPAPARGACMSAGVSFRAAAANADRVLIGTVSNVAPEPEAVGYGRAFTLNVEHAVRGPADVVIQFRDLVSSASCKQVVLVREGDRIALALGATDFEPPEEVNAIAYLEGTPFRQDTERVTVAEAFAAAGVTPPDTAVAPRGGSVLTAVGTALLLFAGILGATWAANARRRR